jgi:hypothetical protein
MTFELELSRRSLFSGLGALIAAPAIVRAASLMPVRAIMPDWGNIYPTLNEINPGWLHGILGANLPPEMWDISMLKNSDSFIANITSRWDEAFCEHDDRSPRIGAQLRIRLPQPDDA